MERLGGDIKVARAGLSDSHFSVSPDCSCSQLRPSFPLAVEDAYVTQQRTPDHQRCCLPQNNLSALLFADAASPAPSPVLSGVFVHDATASADASLRLFRGGLEPARGLEFILCETRR